MNSLERDIYFCKDCLKINKLEDYSEGTMREKYQQIKKKLEVGRATGKDIVIENICFSGGGIKSMSYVGALQVLQDFNLLNNVKRIAASSAGTPLALLLAFRFTIQEMRDLLFKDQSHYLDRSKSWLLTRVIPTLTGNYGLHAGTVIVDEMKKLVNDSFDKHFPEFRKKRALDRNIPEYDPTFLDLNEKFNIELVIIGTNLNKKTVEYFCPRLTPNMPLYIAARISMSYPLMYEYVNYNGYSYIDSVCSYPLHIFYDGDDDTLVKNPLTEHILLPTLDLNIFDKTIGFNNYNIETDGNIEDNPESTPHNYIIDLIENNNSTPIKGFIDYILSVINTAQYFIEKSEIRMVNSHKKDDYFKHTVCAILKHLNAFDLSPSVDQRSDAVTLYKLKMLQWIDDKVRSME
jgi:predicted acylesterase/phospholipase RssA